ncbi:ankyrin repeat-containing domain protein [Dunaliella salina]|uniref:Ankyrin repeat-containing domain protein n=1 Tax=Dunaliella salina TaxID=3046 RepID=A0ABQ7GIP7_DUNSA|nr:ankyrin repeat-containing domain protein [Dunaliella salina]|eukprot:KAF5834458.1 ankyrin repeat-containing domain protein [Dunaliella salina]
MDQSVGEKYAVLKDDPELKCIFDDVMKDGPVALQKYWNDTELMTKVSAKMGGVKLNGAGAQRSTDPSQAAATLHGAAKMGDVDAVTKHLDEGKSVDEPNERGITALGVAVGFNRAAVVKVLLQRGAEVDKRDGQGNTALHYAAGYGRKEIAELLLESGADLVALNNAKQKPVDAARTNNEKSMVQYLEGLEVNKA